MWQNFAVGIASGMHLKSVKCFLQIHLEFYQNVQFSSPTSLSNSCPWIHCMTILFNISVTVFVIMSDGSWILDKYSSCIQILFTCAQWRLALSRYQLQTSVLCGEELGCVCVCVWGGVWCLWLDCRGHGRSRPSVTQTICMLFKSVAQTGLWWMLFSVIMFRHGAGRLLPLCRSFVCLCAHLYTRCDACRSTVHTHTFSEGSLP